MFSKILIANRGEIAVRVIRTARAMGIETVAVYSEADADALHVRKADEAVAIGPAPSVESYLKIDAILEAVRLTGAEAVHPGYGFLAENAAFARALGEAGITFIGPGAEALALMGDKIESKKLAMRTGLGMIPGPTDSVANPEQAVRIAREIGYPVMIKPSAGGGGKGLRIARNDEETREGVRAARSEAKSSFGDDRVFLEKFIERPRHIEIQLLADAEGHAIHLGERECSIQRRHQKVIEEAPSPFLDAEMRQAMCQQAVALAKAVDYRSAGTVEFIVDQERNFYFLEMNTRLQVEHPVTEMVTGIDLVEQMIRIAAGEKLKLRQKDIVVAGHAIECRIYAEDPARGFLPSPGRLIRYRPPETNASVRLDSGVDEGAEITLFYDPMIAKLCTHGATREEAIALMREALDHTDLKGVFNNIRFLAAVMASARFAAGETTTSFISEEFPEAFKGTEPDAGETALMVSVALLVHLRERQREMHISGNKQSRRPEFGGEWVVRIGGADHSVSATPSADGVDVLLDGRILEVRSGWRPGERVLEGSVDGKRIVVQIERRIEGYVLSRGGVRVKAVVLTARAAELAALMPYKPPPDMSRYLRTPMPGLVVSIAVEEGDEVKAGQPLAVVDAMKMENLLRAERDGRVAKICAAKGDSLTADQVILEFE